MEKLSLSLPHVLLIALTRTMLGAGVGLLAADRLTPEQRKAVGWTLVGVGILTTGPLVAEAVLGHCCRHARPPEPASTC